MNYSTLLRRSVDFDTYAHGDLGGTGSTPLGLYEAYPNELERPLLLSLIQLLWDRAEANGYAHHTNTPPHAGQDPHGAPRNSPLARRQKPEFLRADGAVIDVCGGSPCVP